MIVWELKGTHVIYRASNGKTYVLPKDMWGDPEPNYPEIEVKVPKHLQKAYRAQKKRKQ
jgi:hypothetical protein